MIAGDIATYVNALGASEGDERLRAALALAAGEYTVEAYNDRGFEEKYLLGDRGADLLLKAGALSSVFLYADGTADRPSYVGWSSLIEGIGPDASREDIVRVFGEPHRSSELAMLYGVEGGFIRFAFDDGILTMAVAQREAPGGGGAPASPEVSDSTVPDTVAIPDSVTIPDIEGDLSVFLKALGTSIYSPEHCELIVLAGPAMEIDKEEQEGASWEYHRFPKSGVILQFKDEALVGALIRLIADEDEPAYPWIDRLITGFALPAARARINEYFGVPRYVSEETDLYLTAQRYVQFNYESEMSVDVTVILPGVDV